MPTQQYVLLPAQGLRAEENVTPKAYEFLATSERALGAEMAMPFPGVTVLDSIDAVGPKLVELTPEARLAIKAQQPGLRIVPVVYYRTQAVRMMIELPVSALAKAISKITLKVVSAKDGKPVSNAFVVAFTDFKARRGAQGKTNAKGEVKLALGASSKKLQRLYVYADAGCWNALKRSLTIKSGDVIKLTSIDLAYTDALRHFYGNQPETAGNGVRVGVIDTGIALNHSDLHVDGGVNTVTGEDPDDFGDNGEHHGAHVAGIIAARGIPPTGIRGLAPAVTLRSYRVFGQNQGSASNFAIAKAIDRAVADGCDIINMSLGGGPPDELTSEAIQDARAQGCLAFVAAGNDDRSPVSFPASLSLSVAVSAMGRKGTFPTGSTEIGNIEAPYGKDKKNFIAAFSNVGPEIDLTGPGVGIISTVPSGYAIMDGTSMACPAVSGAAANILAELPEVLAMPRNQARSDATLRAVYKAASELGFGLNYEGQGILLGG